MLSFHASITCDSFNVWVCCSSQPSAARGDFYHQCLAQGTVKCSCCFVFCKPTDATSVPSRWHSMLSRGSRFVPRLLRRGGCINMKFSDLRVLRASPAALASKQPVLALRHREVAKAKPPCQRPCSWSRGIYACEFAVIQGAPPLLLSLESVRETRAFGLPTSVCNHDRFQCC